MKNLLDRIDKNIDNPDELSKILVELTALLFWQGTKLAQANFEYSKAILVNLDKKQDGKKISVAEAERRADKDTKCEHDEKKYAREAMVEMLNSLKARLKILNNELEKSGGLNA